jgi:hypothetical protein
MIQVDRMVGASNERMFQNIFQLPDVPRIVVCFQYPERRSIDIPHILPHHAIQSSHAMFNQG